MKLIVLESEEIRYEENKCTSKQYEYLRSLMSKNKHEIVWLDKLAFNGRNKLTKKSASKLIDILKRKEEFELRELND